MELACWRWHSFLLLWLLGQWASLAQRPSPEDMVANKVEEMREKKLRETTGLPDNAVRSVDVDGNKYQLTKKTARKLMKSLTKAVLKSIAEPEVKLALDKITETIDDIALIRDHRVKILSPVWYTATIDIVKKYGFTNMMQAFKAATKFGELVRDQGIMDNAKVVLSIINGREEPEAPQDAEVLWKEVKDLAAHFVTMSKEDRKAALTKAFELVYKLTVDGKLTKPGAEVFAETMDNIIGRGGDTYVEDHMVELYPNITQAVEGSPEKAVLLKC